MGDPEGVEEEDPGCHLHQDDDQRGYRRNRHADEPSSARHELGHGQRDQLEIDEGGCDRDADDDEGNDEQLAGRGCKVSHRPIVAVLDLLVAIHVAVDAPRRFEECVHRLADPFEDSLELFPARGHRRQDLVPLGARGPVLLKRIFLRLDGRVVDVVEQVLDSGGVHPFDVRYRLNHIAPSWSRGRHLGGVSIIGIDLGDVLVQLEVERRIFCEVPGVVRLEPPELLLDVLLLRVAPGFEEQLAAARLQPFGGLVAPAGDEVEPTRETLSESFQDPLNRLPREVHEDHGGDDQDQNRRTGAVRPQVKPFHGKALSSLTS